MDLFSRKVVGWAIKDSLATDLVSQALRQAIELRRPPQGLLHHSDRGCQYTSDAYQQTLRTLGINCSMSRRGNCYDNAAMERFFWSLKHEWTNYIEPTMRFTKMGQQRDQACSGTLKRSTTTSEFIRPWATKPPTNSKPITPRLPN